MPDRPLEDFVQEVIRDATENIVKNDTPIERAINKELVEKLWDKYNQIPDGIELIHFAIMIRILKHWEKKKKPVSITELREYLQELEDFPRPGRPHVKAQIMRTATEDTESLDYEYTYAERLWNREKWEGSKN